MLSWNLLGLMIIITLMNDVEAKSNHIVLSFHVKDTNIHLDMEGAKVFFKCLCSTSSQCDFILEYTSEKTILHWDNETTVDDNAYVYFSTLYVCTLYTQFQNKIICSLDQHKNIDYCIIQFNETGCANILSSVNCSADNVAITWTQPNYKITCLLNHDTLCDVISDEENLNYTVKECGSNKSISPADNLTPSTTNRENPITTEQVTEVNHIEDITGNNLSIILGVSISLAVMFIIVVVLLVALFTRRKKAKALKASMCNDLHQGKTTMKGASDAKFVKTCAPAKTSPAVEPYHVVQIDELIDDSSPTHKRKFSLQESNHRSTHCRDVAKFSDTNIGDKNYIVQDKITNFKENYANKELNVYSKLGERIKGEHNIYGSLKVPMGSDQSRCLSSEDSDQMIASNSPESIYFELEKINRNSDLSTGSENSVK